MSWIKYGVVLSVAAMLSACGSSSGGSAPSSSSLSSPASGKPGSRTPEGPGSGTSSPGSPSSTSSGKVVDISGGEVLGGSTVIPSDLPEKGGGSKQVQAGTLTSGDYDDLLNTDVYQDYISKFLQSAPSNFAIPYVDVDSKIAIEVKDVEGEPVRGARVTLSAEQTVLQTLTTPVNGVANVYAGFDELPATFDVSVAIGDGMPLEQTITLADLQQMDNTISFDLQSMNVPVSKLDVALVIDTTGSMGDEIRYLQAELTQVFKDLAATNANLDIHTGLVAYRDIGDVYVTEKYDFVPELSFFEQNLNFLTASGGGDYPEAMDKALADALSLKWREDSVKILLLVADAPPHDNKMMAAWAPVKQAREKQIHIVPVAASGVADTAEFLMRSAAALTNSRYIFLTDDSGVGNPHAEPSIDCYVVTRLDSNIRRVMASLIGGERIEAAEEEIIRTSGNYNKGVCEPPVNTQPEPVAAKIVGFSTEECLCCSYVELEVDGQSYFVDDFPSEGINTAKLPMDVTVTFKDYTGTCPNRTVSASYFDGQDSADMPKSDRYVF